MKSTIELALHAAVMTVVVACQFGCKQSDRTINLGSKEISTQQPISLGGMLAGVSRDGDHIALLDEVDLEHAKMNVIDTSELKKIASIDLGSTGGEGIIFSENGEVLYFGNPPGYTAWSYQSGIKSLFSREVPRARFSYLPWGTGWNYERTVAITYPNSPAAGLERPGKDSKEPGTVLVATGQSLKMDPQDQGGFDEYGNAWIGHGRSWTKIDRTGNSVKIANHPKYLAFDQTKDRGSRHLRDTSQEMDYKGAKAYISCVWLTDDRAVPYREKVKGRTTERNQPYRAALVMAVADLEDYGFLPGKDMVYVVSGSGSYLVPFTIQPSKESAR